MQLLWSLESVSSSPGWIDGSGFWIHCKNCQHTTFIFMGSGVLYGRCVLGFLPLSAFTFWSLDQLVVETLGVAFVRTYVRTYVRSSVTLFLGNRSLLFYETLQLVRACRCEKNVPSAFLKIFTVLAILAKNCPKWPVWPK